MKSEDIRKAFESITPSDEAKERMLKAIIEKSQTATENTSARPADTPWYVKFRAQIGVCGAAAVCAAVFAITVMNPGIANIGGKDNFVETQPYCESTETRAAVTTVITDISDADQTTAYTTSAPKKAANHTEKTPQNTTGTSEVLSAAVIECSAATVQTQRTIITEIATTTAPKETTQSVITTATEIPTQTETAATTASGNPSLYGNLFDFSRATWAGRSYATDYAEVSYGKLMNLLGSGVAMDDENGTYTILIYEMKGVPVEEGFAVQYIGQTNYYAFYNVV